MQEKVAEGDLAVRKVAGETNPADLLTKGLGQELLNRHVDFAGVQVRTMEQDQPTKINNVRSSWAGAIAPAVVQKLEYIDSVCNRYVQGGMGNIQHNKTGREGTGMSSLSVGYSMHSQEGNIRGEGEERGDERTKNARK